MTSHNENGNSKSFVLTSEALNAALPDMRLSTRAVHADDFATPHRAIAPGIQTAVNFRYARDPDNLKPQDNTDPNAPQDSHIYGRYTNSNSTRFETVLRSVFGGDCVAYPSGLAAWNAVMVLLSPKRVFLGPGYHGIDRNLVLQARTNGVEKFPLEDIDQLRAGDLLHIETPVNPFGEARNIAYYAAKAKAAGAYISVDSTFAPPPLQDALQYDVDFVIHSGTKYVGGHSDMLCGILVVNPKRSGWAEQCIQDRRVMGCVIGNFESWLGIRSIRTLELRVTKQSKTATALVSWLTSEMQDAGSIISKTVDNVIHASKQEADIKEGWLLKQMPNGFGPVFGLRMKSAEHARRLPSRLYVFQHATSLGGVESLMEWRTMSDEGRDPNFMRVSCGVEDCEDLKADIVQALQSLARDFPL